MSIRQDRYFDYPLVYQSTLRAFQTSRMELFAGIVNVNYFFIDLKDI